MNIEKFTLSVPFTCFLRIPTDDRYDSWYRAISQYADPPYKGLICSAHFSDDDLTKGKTRKLKKGALPQIFPREENNHIDDIDGENDYIAEIEPNVSNSQIDIQNENGSNEQHRQLYQELLIEKSKWNIEEQKLKHRIQELELKIGEQKKEIKFWNQKFNREKKNKESLSDLLKELHAEKLLDKDNFDTLQASIFTKLFF